MCVGKRGREREVEGSGNKEKRWKKEIRTGYCKRKHKYAIHVYNTITRRSV